MDTDTQSGFVRQRRNLLVMSLVVLFVEVADLKFVKFSVLGNEASFGNPQVVNAALWVFLIYWFIRYSQYFHDIGDTGLVGSIKQKRRQLVGRFAFKRLFRDPKFVQTLVARDGSKLFATRREHLVFSDYWSTVSGRLEFLVSADPNASSGVVKEEDFTVCGPLLHVSTLLATAHVLLRTKYLTEYILPFILFLLPWCFTSLSAKSWLISLLN